MRKLTPVALFSIFFLATTLAAAQLCFDIAEAFKPPLLQTLQEDYRPLMCSDNVLAFAQRLKTQKLDLSQAQAVVVRHKGAPHLAIWPQKQKLTFESKTYLPSGWTFHVFVVVDGLVLDMDYTETAQAIGLKAYMENMWQQDELKNFVIQVKPLVEYTEADTYGTFKNALALTVEDFMTTLANSTCFQDSSGDLNLW